MTLLAGLKWTCKCGHINTSQLWHSDEDKHGEEYENDAVPNDCGLNWDEPCENCKLYELAVDEKKTGNGLIGWDIVPVDDA